jgi:hypothetical protein
VRFARGARLVADVRAAVKELAASANRARTFREHCSGTLGAALAASLALQEALSSRAVAEAHPSLLLHAGGEVQVAVSHAQGLVSKYGRQAALGALLRRSSKVEVESKFAEVTAQLNALEDALWQKIDPENRLRRELRPGPPPPGASRSITPTKLPAVLAASSGAAPNTGWGHGGGAIAEGPPGGALQLLNASSLHAPAAARGSHRLARRTLRKASQHKVVGGLLWFPDPDGDGPDGCLAWAAHSSIKVVNLSSNVTTVITGAAGGLTAFCYSVSGGHGVRCSGVRSGGQLSCNCWLASHVLAAWLHSAALG